MPRRPHDAPKADRARPPAERDTRTCARCGRPFSWRRKWARDWDQVRYCSDRCRAGRGGAAASDDAEGQRA